MTPTEPLDSPPQNPAESSPGNPSAGSAEHADQAHRSVRVDGLSSLDPTPERIQRRRLATVTRDLLTHMVVSDADAHQLEEAADRLEEVVALIGELPSGLAYEGFSEAANAGPALRALAEGQFDPDDSERFAFFDQSPLIGLSNPLSPPLVLEHDPADRDAITGRVNFGPAYEGPPGCVHGGYVAAVFDELLGAAQSLSGTQGMTARLEVDYRSPTPLGEELVMRGWVDRTEGRKIWARGTLSAGDRLCAQSEGLFLAIREGIFEDLLAARDR
ncbi:MAG: PaaI family thioesterase [Microthrixaceae bacterium]